MSDYSGFFDEFTNPGMFMHNEANRKSRSRVQGKAMVVVVHKTKVVETQELEDFSSVHVARAAFEKHGPVTVLIKQKGELWRYFEWRCKEKGTIAKRARLIFLMDNKVEPHIKLIAAIGEYE